MIYLDNSATTMPNEEVLDSFIEVNKRFYANPASLHLAGREADALLEQSRQQIRSILQVPDGNVIFTSGGTEANNLALIGFARKLKHRGNHIITTEIEHPSILEAAKQLQLEGFQVDYLSVDQNGHISLEQLRQKLRCDTIVVSIMHVNNEIGAVQAIDQCQQLICEKSRAIFHVDAVQSLGKLPLSLHEKGPDAVTISGHKIHGLKGSGALVTKKNIVPVPITYGGGQENGLRSGTVSLPNAVALARAMRMINENHRVKLFQQWRAQLIPFFEQFDEIKVLAKNEGAPHILAIAFQNIRGEVAVNYFQKNGIIVSTSSACSSKTKEKSHVIEAIKLADEFKEGVIRISFGNDNQVAHLQELEKVTEQFIQLLKRGHTNDFK